MRPSLAFLYWRGAPARASPPLVKIDRATFYRHHPASVQTGNPPLFPDLTFHLPCDEINRSKPQVWAVVGPSSSGKTTLLEIFKGLHTCIPPTARSFPHLATIGNRDVRLFDKRDLRLRNPVNAIQYVGFGGRGDKLGQNDTRGAYLAARYEARREATDFSLNDYLKGNTELNPVEEELNNFQKGRDQTWFKKAVKIMKLHDLLDLPVNTLSNGQTRRARIAKALMQRPRLMLLDEPFLGIDPLSRATMSPLLFTLSRRNGPQIILALQPQDELPKWITHLIYLDLGCTIKHMGTKESVVKAAREAGDPINLTAQKPRRWRNNVRIREQETEDEQNSAIADLGNLDHPELNVSEDDQNVEKSSSNSSQPNNMNRWDINYDVPIPSTDELKEPLIELKGVQVKYGNRTVLGHGQQEVDGELKDGFWWNINRGERWAVLGPNGSGKTTLLSLLTSDHPQSYSQPLLFFGRSRLPSPGTPGLSLFDIQSRLGHASPELHAFFPRHLSVRQTIESAWADSFLGKPHLTHARDNAVDALLRWFRAELDPGYTPASDGDEGADMVDSLAMHHNKTDHPAWYSRATRAMDAYLEHEPDWADSTPLSTLSFGAQRVVLFLRALAKKPDLLVLDEAFSGLDERERIKSMMFLAYGEGVWLKPEVGRELNNRVKVRTVLGKRGKVVFGGWEARQALVVVSHRREEVPGLVDRWVCLPGQENAESVGIRFGEITYEMRMRQRMKGPGDWWNKVWSGFGEEKDGGYRGKERRVYWYDK